MAFGVGLIADHRSAHDEFGPMLSQCGLNLSFAATANAFFRDAADDGLLCVVIDLPGQRGLEALEFLRARGIDAPAILIADRDEAFAPDRLARACTLDVLTRPAGASELLAWIECVCTARMVLERRRAA